MTDMDKQDLDELIECARDQRTIILNAHEATAEWLETIKGIAPEDLAVAWPAAREQLTKSIEGSIKLLMQLSLFCDAIADRLEEAREERPW